jgi:uncharacterized protein (TIGR03437 family)
MGLSKCVWIWLAAFATPLVVNAQCVNFPSNLIPFSSVYYVTAADAAGDHLVVGRLAGSLSSISALPVAASVNQTFCGQVQLAPQQVYSNVYVQTSAEQMGSYPEFAGLLTDPNPLNNNAPFPGGVIPSGSLGAVYAFRIGPAQPPQQPAWALTGSMGQGWVQHVAVLLPNGQVLITGNCQSCIAQGPVALIYDPPTGTFLPAATPLFTHGPGATGTLLNNGQVLITGGINAPISAELYNPATNQFSPLGSSSFTHFENFTATLLTDGRVLIAGGQNVDNTAVAEAEIFDPSIDTFIRIGSMVHARANHTATLLPNGNVLIAGGCSTNQCFNTGEIFNPANQGTFTATSPMYNTRDGGYAVLLPNGKVLIGGGDDSTVAPAAELYDPAKGTFSVTGSMPAGTVEHASASLLSSGQVLIAGGDVVLPTIRTPLITAELYDPALGSFSLAGNLTVGRELATTTLLPDGRVLLTGGQSSSTNPTIYSSAEIYTPVVQGLVTSQTGVTFRAAPGGSPAAQIVQVLSPFDTIPWTLSVKTYSGGSWLSATPSGATSVPGASPTPVSINVNTSGLSAQPYYGVVTLTPTDKIHPAVSITVVLNIVPPGTAVPLQVSPGGLVFVTTPGVTPAPRSFNLLNVSSTTIGFTATGASSAKWVSVSQTGVVTSSQPASITVTPVVGNLTAGAYPGTVSLSFSDNTTQVVNLLLVVSPTAKPSARGPVPEATTSSCTPTQLLPVLTSLSSGFSVSAGWPVPIIAQVVDSCGSAINTGTVVASFTNGDSPLSMIPVGGGNWSATWVPGRGYSGASVRVDANTVNPGLTGSALVSATVVANPTAPVIYPGGVVSSGDYSSPPALGLLVSIFGSGLADSGYPAGLPLPSTLGTTSVLLSNGESLPLLYAADGLINVLIPYDIAVNSTTQLIVQRGSAISVPTQTVVFGAAPSILSTAGNGMGQGHAYVIGAGGVETLATTLTPAQPGDSIVIYCVGLGQISPALQAGAITPYPPLYSATAPVTVTFGNVTVAAGFAGLTPGLAGLYQVNVTVPANAQIGNQVPVMISAGGKSSSGSIFMSIR